jgi:hypothetical protein
MPVAKSESCGLKVSWHLPGTPDECCQLKKMTVDVRLGLSRSSMNTLCAIRQSVLVYLSRLGTTRRQGPAQP